MNYKNILVTGGAGYIGSHMVFALREAGYNPFVLDNLSRGFSNCLSNTPFFNIDLRSQKGIFDLFSSYQFDAVLHFAALSYVGESVANPSMYYSNNVLGTLNLLDVMRIFNTPPVVFSSSCATYGEPKVTLISEAHRQSPINPYGQGKLFIELALRDYATAYGQKSISLRYFNAAGCDVLGRTGEQHDPETHLIPLILKEALRIKHGGNPADTQLKVFGDDFPTPDGSCIRDFIHVTDLCQAHLLAMRRLLDGEVAGAEYYNLANGRGFSVLEVIEACRQLTGQPIQFHFEERRCGDPAHLVGDSTRAKEILNWTPQIPKLNLIISSAWHWMLQTKK